MSVSYCANALYAKAHAMYGKRLRKQNYDELVNCRSLQELVSYLKSHTDYAETFSNAPSEINAAQIEELLRLHQLEGFESLCRYEISAGENFYQYFIIENEVNQLLSFIRLLITGSPEKYLNSLPPFFNKHMELDLIKVAKSRSFHELIQAIDGTPYKQILAPFSDIYNEKGVYVKMESALNDHLKQFLFTVVDKGTHKGKKQLHELVNYQFDMKTVVNIYRLIRLSDADTLDIKSYINTQFTNFSQKEINMLIDAPRATDMLRLMPETYYKKDFADIEFTYLEGTVQKIMYKKYVKSMRYLTNPEAAILCYVFLADNEVKNIVHITEGIKYNIPPQKISAILVGAN